MSNDSVGNIDIHRMLVSWDENTTWNSMGSGIQRDDSEANATADSTLVAPTPIGTYTINNLQSSLQAWSDGATNYGWALFDDSTDDLRVLSSENGTVSVRPLLTVDYTLNLYRSVGTNTGNLNTGGETVTISGTTATFTGSMPANIGVGDVLEYQDGGSNWQVAFIEGRTSDTIYTVSDATGATPVATAGSVAVNVYRAYTSLFNWEAQDENDAIIDPLVEDFDTSTDLVSANTVMLVAAYADGPDTNPNGVTISGWTTGANNYIRVYTPVSTSEVGTSQRHTGTAGTGYVLRPSTLSPATNFRLLQILENYVRIEGLELDGTDIQNGENMDGILVSTSTAGTDNRIEGNLIHDIRNSNNTPASTRSLGGILLQNGSQDLVKIRQYYLRYREPQHRHWLKGLWDSTEGGCGRSVPLQ